MSVSDIPDKVKHRLWATSAGRCHYCNTPLWEDMLTKRHYNTAYIAHIYGENAKSARYDPVLSSELRRDFSNLMLLCDAHHRLVDIEDVAGHPPEFLFRMKQAHEAKIELQTRSLSHHQSHILHYVANIGSNRPIVTFEHSQTAIFPQHPAEARPIDLSFQNSAFVDDEETFWSIERTNLLRGFKDKVRSRHGADIKHLSVFAIAPQPLLIVLGRLLADMSDISVYQHQKEPADHWGWLDEHTPVRYSIIRPSKSGSTIALNLSLSATISNHRIAAVLGEDTAIWTLRIKTPHNDFLKTRGQLHDFRAALRRTLAAIKTSCDDDQLLHVFPAVPVAAAVEIGRVWSPKADLPLRIYDQNSKRDGFIHALDIHHGDEG